MKNWRVAHLGKEHLWCFHAHSPCFDALAPKWIDKQLFQGECWLFFSSQLPSGVFTGNTLSDYHVLVAGLQRYSETASNLFFLHPLRKQPNESGQLNKTGIKPGEFMSAIYVETGIKEVINIIIAETKWGHIRQM